MRIVLIGNYLPDKQESMERFAKMLHSGLNEAGIPSVIWRPTTLFGLITKSAHSGLGKWFGYIDKWIVFPVVISWRLKFTELRKSNVRFHICDHSNSPYLQYLPQDQTVITCHDVLAIRGALGYTDAYCPASGLGKILQKWILHFLTKAKYVICDSNMTLKQLRELATEKSKKNINWQVIHVGFNNVFRPLNLTEATSSLRHAGVNPDTPYILHVGSGLPRKNRKLLLDMVAIMGDKWRGTICYAGQGVDKELMNHAISLGLEKRIIAVVKPDHHVLLALYSACEAFIFPSFSEGFGWPVIEAQACGVPVISSIIEPMPEISGGAALLANPADPAAFAAAFLSLRDKSLKEDLIQKGFENCKRFAPEQMVDAYLTIHGAKQDTFQIL